jgi:hypothetical protein
MIALLFLTPALFASASPDHQITVVTRTVDGKPLECIFAVLYKVAEWDGAKYALIPPFEDSGAAVGSFDFSDLWSTLGTGGNEYNNLSKTLDDFALHEEIPALAGMKSDPTGNNIVFSNLEAGLYLVSQREYTGVCGSSDCNNLTYQMTPALVPLPFFNSLANGWFEQTRLFPKIILPPVEIPDPTPSPGDEPSSPPGGDPFFPPGPDPTPSPDPSPSPGDDPSPSPGDDPTPSPGPSPSPGNDPSPSPGDDPSLPPGDGGDGGTEEGEIPIIPPAGNTEDEEDIDIDNTQRETLPQTGALRWPVPVLSVAGIVITSAGIRIVCKDKAGSREND